MTASIWSTVLHLTELHKAGIVNPYGRIPGFQQVCKEEKENGCSCLPSTPEKEMGSSPATWVRELLAVLAVLMILGTLINSYSRNLHFRCIFTYQT